VRRFALELVRMNSPFAHAPWEAPEAVLAAAGRALGISYPAPFVDLAHGWAHGRARALAAFAVPRGETR